MDYGKQHFILFSKETAVILNAAQQFPKHNTYKQADRTHSVLSVDWPALAEDRVHFRGHIMTNGKSEPDTHQM